MNNSNKELTFYSQNLLFIYTSQLGDSTNIFLSIVDKMDENNSLLYDEGLMYLRRQLNIKTSVLESSIKRLVREKLILLYKNSLFINPYIVSMKRGSGHQRLCQTFSYWMENINKKKNKNNLEE